MHIRRRHFDDPPEINLIPLIDVLLVIIIFLAVSTTFSTERSIQVSLPQAQSQTELAGSLEITVTADGQFALAGRLLPDNTMQTLVSALTSMPGITEQTVLIIRADANATHQNVVSAMQAARQAGLSRISFAARIAN